ncbi:uncharacterized protein LOC110697593 [Chenopodium quinoa]|uniref:uncharacterized protein LOC110697593 n=1 Tax=Chenopodium quinoa TaxID=63459 RepID=UPI000B77A855|nr:uncharacterized protein LOC110697593 [Chenopodium quinoa]
MVEKCYRVDVVNEELDRLGRVVMNPQDPMVEALTCEEEYHSQEAKEFVMAIDEAKMKEEDDPRGEELELAEEKLEESYTTDDIKGISPSFFMHRIHLEDDQATSVEPQRRLNPNLQEVVKKENFKLREAGIIYAISDNNFNEAFLEAFQKLKEALISSPVVQAPDWSLPFELMCDASDFAVGAVLGQKKDGRSHVIYYASRTFDEAQKNYTTTEKEMLAVVFAMDKF